MSDLPQSKRESGCDPATPETYNPDSVWPMTNRERAQWLAEHGHFDAAEYVLGLPSGRLRPNGGRERAERLCGLGLFDTPARPRGPSFSPGQVIPDTTGGTSPFDPLPPEPVAPGGPGRIITTHLGFDAASGRVTIDGQLGASVAPPAAEIQAMLDSDPNSANAGDGVPSVSDVLNRVSFSEFGGGVLAVDGVDVEPVVTRRVWEQMPQYRQVRFVLAELERRQLERELDADANRDRNAGRLLSIAFVIVAAILVAAFLVLRIAYID